MRSLAFFTLLALCCALASANPYQRILLTRTGDCDEGTQCPGGCCSEANWFCCPDG